MPLLDNLWSVVKGSVAGGLLQDDADLVNTYIPQQLQQGFTDDERRNYAQKIRSVGAAGLLSPGVDSTERAKMIQQNVLGDLLKRQQDAEQAQEKVAVADYMAKLMQPTITPEMALGAKNEGLIGPTVQREKLIGAKNPLAVGDAQKARAMAYRQLAMQFDIPNPTKAEQYRKAADIIDPKAEAYTLKEGETRFVGDKPVTSVPRSSDDAALVKEYKFARSQGYPGSFEQFIITKKEKPMTIQMPKPDKPAIALPAGVQKAEDEDFERYEAAKTLANETSGFINSLASGSIPVTLGSTMSAKTLGFFGSNAPEVTALNDFERFKTRLVNESLRLNKGVQTEGDAQRAVNELLNARSEADAISAMRTLQRLNAEAANRAMASVERRRVNIGLPKPGMMGETVNISPIQLPRDSNAAAAAYNRLPSGSVYIDPQGNQRTKP